MKIKNVKTTVAAAMLLLGLGMSSCGNKTIDVTYKTYYSYENKTAQDVKITRFEKFLINGEYTTKSETNTITPGDTFTQEVNFGGFAAQTLVIKADSVHIKFGSDKILKYYRLKELDRKYSPLFEKNYKKSSNGKGTDLFYYAITDELMGMATDTSN